MDVNVLRDVEVDEFAAEVFAGQDVERRDDPVLDDPLLVVEIVEEEVQRRDALHQTTFHLFPFLLRNDPGNQVERKDPLGTLGISIDVEGDTLPQEGEVHRFPFPIKLLGRHPGQTLLNPPVMRPDLSGGGVHLIEKRFGRVPLQHGPIARPIPGAIQACSRPINARFCEWES